MTNQNNDNTTRMEALAGLFSNLPTDGKCWTQAQRAKFLTAVEAVVDFLVPITGGSVAKSK